MGIAYFVSKTNFQSQNISVPSPTSSPIQTQVLPSSSKIYKNSFFPYSLRLPASYPDPTELLGQDTHSPDILNMVTVFNTSKSVVANITVWRNNSLLTVDQWLKVNGEKAGRNTYPAQSVQFDTISAFVSNRGTVNWYFMAKGYYIYEVGQGDLIGSPPSYKPSQQEIDEQNAILGSFQFTAN